MPGIFRALVAGALLLLPETANAAWQEASSKHFVVYSDDTPAHVQSFATVLERVDKSMRILRGVQDPPVGRMSRLTVYVVRDGAAVRRAFGKGASGVAGFFKPRASGSVAFVPRENLGTDEYDLSAQETLFHEYAHYFMSANMGDVTVPPWFIEGFAEFHATTRVNDDGSVTIGAAPLYRIYGINAGSTFPLAKLLTSYARSGDAEQQNIFYGRSWLLTHYLMADGERRQQLMRYLEALNKGESALDAAKAFGDLKALNSKLNTYIQSRLKAFVVPATSLAIDAVQVRTLSPAEATMMPARLASDSGVDAKTAIAVEKQARALAAPFPHDAAAQNELAEAEFDAGNYDAAKAASGRAYAADPHSIHAMMYQGLAIMAAAAQAHSKDPWPWAEARAWFRKANSADTEFAWPMAMYYFSYGAAGVKPNHNAQDGLLYAHVLAPFDASLGMTAAHIYLERDDTKQAQQVLGSIAYDPHGGKLSTYAQEILTLIDQQGPKAALAKLDRADDPQG